MVAHNPLHRSGQAAFPHPALASGDDAKSPQGIGVADTGRRQPAVNEPPHSVPEHAAVLAPARQRTVPEPTDLESKEVQRRSVHGHPVVTEVPTHDGAQPVAQFRDGVVHASTELSFHQLGLQPLANRLPQHREVSVASLLRADVREAEEVERLGLPLTSLLPVVGRRTSLDFPTRPAAATAVTGGPRSSRISCEVFPYVLGVSDRAGSRRVSRYRRDGWGLPHLLTASAPRRMFLSRLNSRPVRAPVNASTLPSQAAPHDSGSAWVAHPSPYDSFIHNTSPV
jgi:hypothetical protein